MARILVADDEPDLARLVEFKLTRMGHAVVVVHDGAAALAALAGQGYDLLVLDAMMPGVDGFDVLREVRATPAMRDLPVIMLTARGQERDVVLGLSLGAQEYMTKPFSPAELAARVARLLPGADS